MTEDLDTLAADYVLGMLTGPDSIAVEARRLREVALDGAIQAWEVRLAPLSEAIPPVAPDLGLFPAILAAIDQEGDRRTIVALRGRLARWPWTAGMAVAAALAAGIALGGSYRTTGPASRALTAVLAQDAAPPGFLVSIDEDTGRLTVRPYAAARLPGRSYELWLIAAQGEPPRSLGLIDTGRATRSHRLASYSADAIVGATLAVTLEPEGGSPSGSPTGPMVFSGPILRSTL